MNIFYKYSYFTNGEKRLVHMPVISNATLVYKQLLTEEYEWQEFNVIDQERANPI